VRDGAGKTVRAFHSFSNAFFVRKKKKLNEDETWRQGSGAALHTPSESPRLCIFGWSVRCNRARSRRPGSNLHGLLAGPCRIRPGACARCH
jgi:hypothetical protein